MTDEKEAPDQAFFDRADGIIHLANEQLGNETRGKVSASTLYAAARFNAWVSATGFTDADEFARTSDEIVAYFVAEYKKMLTEHLEDYARNFASYMKPD